MCEPTALLVIGGIATAAKTVMDIGSSVAQHGAQDEAHKANKTEANKALKLSLQSLGLRQQQEQDATSTTIMAADRQARQADGLARVSAGEAGVAGASVDMMLSNLERDRVQFQMQANRNLDSTITQLQGEKVGAQAQAQSRINGVVAPNPWATALRIGGSVADGANTAANLLRKPK